MFKRQMEPLNLTALIRNDPPIDTNVKLMTSHYQLHYRNG